MRISEKNVGHASTINRRCKATAIVRTLAKLACAGLMAGCVLAGPVLAGPCSKTSQAALQGCRSEVQDDYWIGLGVCYNLSDSGLVQECRSEVKEGLKEGRDECAEQLDARDEVCDLLGEDEYDPVIDPANFLDKDGIVASPNPYFPLVPGTTFVYEGGGETVRVTVTDETKQILGIETIVVRDVVTLGGEAIEDTNDWFAQDVQGNVWYFGEISQEFENGELVALEGSWTAGVDGAKPGIVMFASPLVGKTYRQEWFLGEAEDLATITSVAASASTPAASCNGDCVETNEFTPLEPGHTESKFYARGVGMILEVGLSGERLELVQVIHASRPH